MHRSFLGRVFKSEQDSSCRTDAARRKIDLPGTPGTRGSCCDPLMCKKGIQASDLLNQQVALQVYGPIALNHKP